MGLNRISWKPYQITLANIVLLTLPMGLNRISWKLGGKYTEKILFHTPTDGFKSD
jgi:hypothetical protein